MPGLEFVPAGAPALAARNSKTTPSAALTAWSGKSAGATAFFAGSGCSGFVLAGALARRHPEV